MASVQLTPDTTVAARPPAGRVLLIVNEGASRVSSRGQNDVLAALSPNHRVDAVTPGSPDEVTALCRGVAAADHDLVVTYGGDGTVSAAARGLLGTGVPLAVVPGGFTNVLARTLGVPLDPKAAATHIADLDRRHSTRPVSLATADGRPYVFAAGMGFSAALMERLAADEKFGLPVAAWHAAAVALRTIAGDAPRLRVDGGGKEFEAIGAITQNSDPLTFFGSRPIRVCDGVELGPPGFALASLQSARIRDVVRLAGGLLANRIDWITSHSRMTHLPPLREVLVTSLDPAGMPVELDGDYLGRRHSVELGVAEEKLLVLA
jgi:diacylglycerol kinase family enzyme